MEAHTIKLIQKKINFNETKYYTLINGKMIELFYFKIDEGTPIFNTISVHNLEKLFKIILGKKHSLMFLFYSDCCDSKILSDVTEDKDEEKKFHKYKEKTMILSHASFEEYGVKNSINFIDNTVINLKNFIEDHSAFFKLIFENIKFKTDIDLKFETVKDFNFRKYESLRYKANTVALYGDNVTINNETKSKISFSNEKFFMFDPNIYHISKQHEIYQYNTVINNEGIIKSCKDKVNTLETLQNDVCNNYLTIKKSLFEDTYNKNISLLEEIISKYDMTDFIDIPTKKIEQFITSTYDFKTLTYTYTEEYSINDVSLDTLNLIKRIITLSKSLEDLDIISNILKVISEFKYEAAEDRFVYIREHLNYQELNIENEINRYSVFSDLDYLIKYYTI